MVARKFWALNPDKITSVDVYKLNNSNYLNFSDAWLGRIDSRDDIRILFSYIPPNAHKYGKHEHFRDGYLLKMNTGINSKNLYLAVYTHKRNGDSQNITAVRPIYDSGSEHFGYYRCPCLLQFIEKKILCD